MLAELIIIANSKEIAAAESMNLVPPREILEKRLLSFDLNEVSFAYISDQGHIVMVSKMDATFTITYNKIIWEAIVKRHENA